MIAGNIAKKGDRKKINAREILAVFEAGKDRAGRRMAKRYGDKCFIQPERGLLDVAVEGGCDEGRACSPQEYAKCEMRIAEFGEVIHTDQRPFAPL